VPIFYGYSYIGLFFGHHQHFGHRSVRLMSAASAPRDFILNMRLVFQFLYLYWFSSAFSVVSLTTSATPLSSKLYFTLSLEIYRYTIRSRYRSYICTLAINANHLYYYFCTHIMFRESNYRGICTILIGEFRYRISRP
jgi:hypothetical protein